MLSPLSSFSLSTRIVLLYEDYPYNIPSIPSPRPPGAPRREQWEYIQAYKKLRPVVIAHYGGSCVKCGAQQRLELDHIYNDGNRHRQQLWEEQLSIEEWLVAEGFPANVIQLLCHDCHTNKTRQVHSQK